MDDLNFLELNEYQEYARDTAAYPDKDRLGGLMYCALKLNGEAGEVAEHIGKALRDDALGQQGYLTHNRRELVIKELGDVLWYVAMLCDEIDVDLETVAKLNLKKLADRKARGVLGGSGDNR